MRRGVVVVVLLLALVGCLAGCTMGQVTPIGDILEHPERFVNKSVHVSGVVLNSTTIQPELGARVKVIGEYDLKDDTGTIHVRTVRNAPANNGEVNISAMVETPVAGAPPQLLDKGGIPVVLYIALGVLVVLAVVLVRLIVGGDRRPKVICPNPNCGAENQQGATVCRRCQQPMVVPPPPPPNSCPNCQAPYSPGDEFCERCGAKLPTKPIIDDSTKEFRGGVAIADLTIIEGEGAGRAQPIPLPNDSKPSVIGRGSDANIPLADDTVSRKHAMIWWDDQAGSFFIQDENSRAGTLVNGQKVVRQALNDNDVIQLGRTKLAFRLIRRT